MIVIGLVSCEKVIETYVGMPFQPDNISAEYKPGLNIFGMLHHGRSYGEYQNYFEVQLIPEITDTSSVVVKDARLTIENKQSGNIFNLFHYGDGVYGNDNINVMSGQQWYYKCTKDTFLITANTIVPNKPKITEGSIVKDEKHISFSIDADTTAYLYDVYYITDTIETNVAVQRIVPQRGLNLEINIEVPHKSNKLLDVLYVIAYDKNYEKYINTSNTFFKPNAFRPRFSTVEGGYGCFASCASIEVNFMATSFRPDKK